MSKTQKYVKQEQEPDNARIIEARKKQLDEVTTLLQEEVECKLTTVEKKDLPLDITGKQIGLINLIVK